jgi:predicted phage terminase large subunit-like protein
MGKNQSADPSALVVGAFDLLSGINNVVEAVSKRRVPSKLEADLIAMQQEYKCVLWGFENNNAYEHSRMTFINNAKRKGVVLPLQGIVNSAGAEVYIDSLEPFVNDMEPSILFHPSLRSLIEQLESWPEKQSHHHYDLLIALWLMHTVAVKRSAGLPSIVTRGRNGITNTRRY